ncbi:hypothetical protein [Helicobacter sp. MIT 14-3879]|uniref:hypothetical protein n=1 Tax=Helicobacter sp. MIT 14-3879 TaxID=2040649 RepID=UPI000E1E7AFE|nr:hypothetical protein [Helicobacter sp. MIT 14-3879]RDU60234.1 hypothetical protein CQA44_10730 [Helicobacter sp. MIT 14-3879]
MRIIDNDGNTIRHTTLWDKDNFVDVKMNDELDIDLYLLGYNYLDDPKQVYPFVSQFYFWELK